jgi:hypothetical protein
MNPYFALKLFLRAQVALLLPLMMAPANAAITSDATESLQGSSLSIQVTDLDSAPDSPFLVADDDNDYDRDDDRDDDDDYDTDINEQDNDRDNDRDDDRDYSSRT